MLIIVVFFMKLANLKQLDSLKNYVLNDRGVFKKYCQTFDLT